MAINLIPSRYLMETLPVTWELDVTFSQDQTDVSEQDNPGTLIAQKYNKKEEKTLFTDVLMSFLQSVYQYQS